MKGLALFKIKTEQKALKTTSLQQKKINLINFKRKTIDLVFGKNRPNKNLIW